MFFDRSRVLMGGFLNTAGSSVSVNTPMLVWSASVGEFMYTMSTVGRGMLPVDQLQNLSKAALYHANSLSPLGISKLFTVLATQSHSDKRVLSRYCERMIDSKFLGFSGREVAIVLNGFVRLGYIDKCLFRAASDFLRSLSSIEFICERDLGLIHNAFAKANVRDDELFEALVPRVLNQLSVLSPQSAGNICHAYGKLGISSESSRSLLIRVARHVCQDTAHRSASSQELSNIVYSFGNLGIVDKDVLDPLFRLVETKLRRFNPVELAALATALSKLEISNKSLMRLLSKQVQSVADKFDAYEITAVLHAFSQLDVSVPKIIFEKIAPEIFSRSKFNSHTACIAYCAYARVEFISPDLSEKLLEVISTENDSQYLVNVLFAMTRLGDRSSSVYAKVVDKLLIRGFTENPINVTQLIYGIGRSDSARTCFYPEEHLLYIKSVTLAMTCDFSPVQFANILHTLSKRPLLDAEEKILLHAICEKGTKFVPELSPQLLSSVAESCARLNMDSILSLVPPQLGRDLDWDIHSLCALSHAGRFNSECLLPMQQMNSYQLCRFLAALEYAQLAPVPEEIVIVLLSRLQDLCDEMTRTELEEILILVRSLAIDIPPPFNIVQPPNSSASRVPVSPLDYTPPVPSGPTASQYISNLLMY